MPCKGAECEPSATPPTTFSAPGSTTFAGGENLTSLPPATPLAAKPNPKPAPLTRAQKLVKALKVCKGEKNKKKRADCEKQARRQYGARASKARRRSRANEVIGREHGLADRVCASADRVHAGNGHPARADGIRRACSGGSEFGVIPGSVTARTCAAADVTCTASTALETQAGAHPTGTVSFALNSETVSPQPGGTVGEVPIGRVRDAVVQLPPGFVGDPQAVPECSDETLKGSSGCPRDTMVGYAVITTASGNVPTQPDLRKARS